ncbi:hypothetical protein [Photobacterium leiognathi]|uniref:Lipoprotein n=1 Tax=Photobacterium leiognathi subsp. mandapamensis TaxID=48408 RepID=A0A2T3KXJ8_PHOLD|nr:hypothetical protein [Photobacterium leiognathi]PSV12375.1 hypothetical protein C0W93_04950 [Photobacterium leiognathi subsp. mandapamensis]
MQFNKSIIATTLLSIFALSGCNSGGSDSTSTSPVVPTKTITVIDGALENAQICVDLNDNNQCDKSDKVLPQLTNKAGKIEVSLDDAKHALIAQIIAGTTKDSDEITPVSHSYSMITDAGKAVITPFTTLANVDPQALSNIAGDLGIDQQVLLGDLSTSPKARILARSMTPLMTDDIKNIAQQKAKFKAVINKIEEAENNDTLSQLENSRIVINKDGKAEIQPLVKNIADVLVGKTWFMASLNNAQNQHSGVLSANFKDKNNLEFTERNETENTPYTINKENNNIVRTFDDGDTDTQKLLYISKNLIIGAMNNIDEAHDLIVWTTNNLDKQQSLPVTTEQFVGKTWYMLADNSDTPSAEPTVFSFTFNADGSITGSEPNESRETFNAGTWSVTNGVLTTTINDENETDTYINTVIEKSSDYMVIKEKRTDDQEVNYAVLFNNKAQAMSILKQWNNLEVTTKVNIASHNDITELSIDKTEADAKNPDLDSPTITIKNGKVTYLDSIFNDGTYYVMGYNPNQNGHNLYAYGPLKTSVLNGRVQDLDFTHAPIVHATNDLND